MQEMAPGLSGLPQAGQLAGVPDVDAAAAPGGLVPGGGTGGRLMLPSDTLPAEGGRAGPAAAPTAAGCGAAAGTVKGFWHDGQRNCLPAELSATDIAVVQFGQRITCGMVGLVLLLGESSYSPPSPRYSGERGWGWGEVVSERST